MSKVVVSSIGAVEGDVRSLLMLQSLKMMMVMFSFILLFLLIPLLLIMKIMI